MANRKFYEKIGKIANSSQEWNEDLEMQKLKKMFNGMMISNPCYYEDQVEDFFKSDLFADIVVVLIDFSAIGENEKNGQVIPGEMALTAFSLRYGVFDNCSIIINHGNEIESKTLERLNTELDLPIQKQENNNYGDTVWILNSFRKKHCYGRGKNEHAPLFCQKSECNRVISCLEFLFRFKGGDQWGYQILPLEYLYLRMARHIYTIDGDQRKDGNDTELLSVLYSKDFAKLARLACNYHHEKATDLDKCPLKMVNVLAYNIIGALVDSRLAFPGRHYPSIGQGNQEAYQRHIQIMAWATTSQCRISVPISKQILEFQEWEKRVNQAAHPYASSINSSLNVQNIWTRHYFDTSPNQISANPRNVWNPHRTSRNFDSGLYQLPPSTSGNPLQSSSAEKNTEFVSKNPFYPNYLNVANQARGATPTPKPSSSNMVKRPLLETPTGNEDQSSTHRRSNFGRFPNESHVIPFPEHPPPNYFPNYGQNAQFSSIANISDLQRSVDNLSIQTPTPASSSQRTNLKAPKSRFFVKKHFRGDRPG